MQPLIKLLNILAFDLLEAVEEEDCQKIDEVLSIMIQQISEARHLVANMIVQLGVSDDSHSAQLAKADFQATMLSRLCEFPFSLLARSQWWNYESPWTRGRLAANRDAINAVGQCTKTIKDLQLRQTCAMRDLDILGDALASLTTKMDELQRVPKAQRIGDDWCRNETLSFQTLYLDALKSLGAKSEDIRQRRKAVYSGNT